MSTEAAAERQIDKSDWGDGPWQNEPDRVQWVHAGYACLALRHPMFGSWCGYVGVDRAHPCYGRDWNTGSLIDELKAHCGINYSAACDGEICHVPEPGMPEDVWWLGFDCHHGFDFSPGLEARERKLGLPSELTLFSETDRFRPRYRDLAYVKAVTESLAEQLRALAQ